MVKKELVIIRGGGDMATGTIQTLHRTGFRVLILEALRPSAIRRMVALSEAVYDGQSTVEDVTCIRCENYAEANQTMVSGNVALLIDPKGKAIQDLAPWAVVDAILAKRNLGTHRGMALKTVALGPGFTAGEDVDIVIETMRGHNLGRIIEEGCALPNTGVPGIIAGYGKERVIRGTCEGYLYGLVKIGDKVKKGQPIAEIVHPDDAGRETSLVRASLAGIIRGLIRDGYPVTNGFKIADIDSRETEYDNCFTISDKSRSIGGAVLTALLYLAKKQGY